MIISLMVYFIQMMGIMASSLYIFIKSIQYNTTAKRKVVFIAWCLLLSVLYAVIEIYLLLIPLVCLITIIFIYFLIKQKFEIVTSAYLLSFGISYFLYYIAVFPVSIITAFFTSNEQIVDAPLDFNEPIFLLGYSIVFILQIVFSVLLFRFRRIKKGFPFIFNKFAIVAALFFTGIILILVTWVNMISQSEEAADIGILYIAGVLIAGVGIYILIRRLITMFQAKKAQQNTAVYYEKLYLEEKVKNEELRKQLKAKSSVLHNFADRLKAMEEAVTQGTGTLEVLQNLQEDWENELDKIKSKTILPSANIPAIDNLFEYYEKQFAAEKITFDLIINGSIRYMVNNVIKQSDLETLIVNHLNDAKKAVMASDNTFRRVTAVIGVSKGCYEFTVLDSGIPFEADTLTRLGTGRVTTHADTGGSGIGFETTFETMRETRASLIINEQEQSNVDYSKSVSIRFDGKNRYIIETYRPDDFPVSDRYMIKRLPICF